MNPEAVTLPSCSVQFCFWTTWGGIYQLTGGDFKIVDFGENSNYMFVQNKSSSYKMKVFSGPNMSGNCKVINKESGFIGLPFAIRSAKRIEPGHTEC